MKPTKLAKQTKPSATGLKIALGITTFIAVVLLITSISLSYIFFKGNLLTVKTSLTHSTIEELISKEYIGNKPDTKAQSEGELKGLVGSLGDPYSQYLTQDETNGFRDSINEQYEGIGVRFSEKDTLFVISGVVDSGPAARAGIQKDDILSKIEGESVSGSSLEQVTTKIKGAAGTSVNLTFMRGSDEKEFTIKREAIKSDLVSYEVDGQFAIIRISSFGDGVASQLETIAGTITQDSSIKGVVLDLRSNTGGILSEGIGATSFFVDPGDVVTSEVGNSETRVDKAQTVKTSLKNYPLAILVDKYTASASEIMAAGVRDNRDGKVKIYGETTYGKGVVQKLFPLPDGGTLKLTVAEWLTPNKDKINKIGIKPDVDVDTDKALDAAKQDLSAKFN